MKLLTEGDRGKAICNHCEAMVTTTYQRRDLPFSDGSGLAKDILAGVCDQCGCVVSTPAQSTPAIAAARRKAEVPVEAVLPSIYIDALDLACYRIDPSASSDFRKPLFVFYMKRMAGAKRRRLVGTLKEKSAGQYSRRRFSMKVSAELAETIDSLAKSWSVSKTDVIKDVVEMIHGDIVEPEVPKHQRALKLIASASAS